MAAALFGVASVGVALGGMSQSEASAALSEAWAQRGIVRDGDRAIPVNPALLGIALDADATARAAVRYGRGSGGIGGTLGALFGHAFVEPVLTVDNAAASTGLTQLAAQVEQPAVNAGVQFLNGRVEPRPAANGRALDIGATIAHLQRDPSAELADAPLDLVMAPVAPAVTDAGPLVQAASAILANPLTICAYNPATDTTTPWTVMPEQWSAWLTADADANSAFGLRLSLDAPALSAYLAGKQSELGAAHYLKVDESVASVQSAISAGNTNPSICVYNHDRQHVVGAGETIISIAWDYGVPYPWIQDELSGCCLAAGERQRCCPTGWRLLNGSPGR